MKLLRMRISALLLALFMILVCVGCGAVETDPDKSSTGGTKDPTTNSTKEESDPEGNGSETVDDGEQVTKENAKEKLSDACNKFVALTAAKLTVVSDNNGEAFTDIVYAFKDASENTIVYMENEVMNGNMDYSYMVGKSEYAKYHYTDEIYCYETEEDISMELLLDEIMMGKSSDVIDAFCMTDFEIQKSGSGYELVLKTTDAVAFFSIFMGKETAQDKYGNITGFEGCVAFAMDADGNFTKTEVKANMKNEDTTATQSVTCEISEHNNKGIAVAEPDWVTEYKNNQSDDLPDDGNDKHPDGEALYEKIGAAMQSILHADSLKLVSVSEENSGEATQRIELSFASVKNENGKYTIYGSLDNGSETYVAPDGIFYEYYDGNVVTDKGPKFDLGYMLTYYFNEYGFSDVNGTLARMRGKDYLTQTTENGVKYTILMDYGAHAAMIEPKLMDDEQFQAMISQIVKSEVILSYEVSEAGELVGLSYSAYIDIGVRKMTTTNTVKILSVNEPITVTEPLWLPNA